MLTPLILTAMQVLVAVLVLVPLVHPLVAGLVVVQEPAEELVREVIVAVYSSPDSKITIKKHPFESQ